MRLPEDAALVADVLAGRDEAYRTLVERYQEVLYRRAVALTEDPETAADMVQDTLVRAYRKLSSCSDPARFGGWVYRMLRNACLDELRSPRHRGTALDPGIAVAAHNPQADVERLEIREAVQSALGHLSPILREAFVLKHVEGLSYEEMQRETGVARSALKMRVKRAREELEVALAPLAAEHVTPSRPEPSYE
ncbi:MAG TPA: RNA polymerase sigma factor [Longimicrobiales bacterium]|nr:RNA polymerase sigma factor [Longimicrobiales bacterium]